MILALIGIGLFLLILLAYSCIKMSSIWDEVEEKIANDNLGITGRHEAGDEK